jgi:hypothetical protein
MTWVDPLPIKKQICYRVIVQGKSIETAARETNHSPEAITRYVKDYNGKRSLRPNGAQA